MCPSGLLSTLPACGLLWPVPEAPWDPVEVGRVCPVGIRELEENGALPDFLPELVMSLPRMSVLQSHPHNFYLQVR